ncbi:MAG: NAD(P)-binding protein, partial [Anaerolineae bacterium]|nr:NAD(P)-binding protein [Anaerolineae bacterium]
MALRPARKAPRTAIRSSACRITLNPMQQENGVIIVGGGWAGMAAALELDRHHIPVTVMESAVRLGGRARSVYSGTQCLDNGQHLLIGAYSETLRLLRLMGINEADVLDRTPLSLLVLGDGSPLELSTPPLPAPLHLVWGLLGAKGVSTPDKLQALRMSLSLTISRFSLAEDTSVAELLRR